MSKVRLATFSCRKEAYFELHFFLFDNSFQLVINKSINTNCYRNDNKETTLRDKISLLNCIATNNVEYL